MKLLPCISNSHVTIIQLVQSLCIVVRFRMPKPEPFSLYFLKYFLTECCSVTCCCVTYLMKSTIDTRYSEIFPNLCSSSKLLYHGDFVDINIVRLIGCTVVLCYLMLSRGNFCKIIRI